jgi:hypothetical protein
MRKHDYQKETKWTSSEQNFLIVGTS